MDKFFSRQQISRMEAEINSLTQRMCNKLLRTAGDVLDIQTVYSCLVTDVISSYCFGEPIGFTDQVCSCPPGPFILRKDVADKERR